MPYLHDKRFYAIGDVHGNCRMFLSLLQKILWDAGKRGIVRPRLVLIGDLIDRGTNSRGVLDTLASRWFETSFDCIYIRGNHEQYLLDAFNDDEDAFDWLANHSAGATLESYGIPIAQGHTFALSAFWSIFPSKHLALVQSSRLSYHVGRYFFCHGGIDPNRRLEDQAPEVLMRGCTVFWSAEEFPEGVCCVHGHIPTGSATRVHNHINLDTAAGYCWGYLSAVGLDPDGTVETFRADATENTADNRDADPLEDYLDVAA
jgi:serine/threonine protein phosphatase 1